MIKALKTWKTKIQQHVQRTLESKIFLALLAGSILYGIIVAIHLGLQMLIEG